MSLWVSSVSLHRGVAFWDLLPPLSKFFLRGFLIYHNSCFKGFVCWSDMFKFKKIYKSIRHEALFHSTECACLIASVFRWMQWGWKKKSLLLIWNKVFNLWHFMFSQQDLFIGKKVGGLYCEQWITYCYQLLKLWDIANCGRALKKLFKLQQGKHTFISALARGTHGKKKGGKEKYEGGWKVILDIPG